MALKAGDVSVFPLDLPVAYCPNGMKDFRYFLAELLYGIGTVCYNPVRAAKHQDPPRKRLASSANPGTERGAERQIRPLGVCPIRGRSTYVRSKAAAIIPHRFLDAERIS